MKNSYHKKNIAILTGRIMGKGGTETVLHVLSNSVEFNKFFDFNIFITEHPANNDFINFVKTLNLVHNIKIDKSINRFFRNISIVLFLITTKADVVIGMKPRYIQIAAIIKKYFNKKYKLVSWIHFSLKHMPGSGNAFEKMQSFLPMADAHLAISRGIADELSSIGIPEKNIHIIYNPLSKQELTIYPSLNTEVVHFVYVGRLYNEQKNITGLFNILSTLNIKIVIDVFGTGQDQMMLQKMANQIFDENIRVIWHGWNSNPWGNINNADALLLTSNYEGFPMTLLESISRGLPVVSYDSPTGPADIVQNGKNGYLIPLGNQEQFKEALIKISKRENFSDRKKIKGTLDFLYDEQYIKRFKNSIYSIISD